MPDNIKTQNGFETAYNYLKNNITKTSEIITVNKTMFNNIFEAIAVNLNLNKEIINVSVKTELLSKDLLCSLNILEQIVLFSEIDDESIQFIYSWIIVADCWVSTINPKNENTMKTKESILYTIRKITLFIEQRKTFIALIESFKTYIVEIKKVKAYEPGVLNVTKNYLETLDLYFKNRKKDKDYSLNSG